MSTSMQTPPQGEDDIVSKFQTAIVTGDLAAFEAGLAGGCDPCDNETYWMILHAITHSHVALVDRFLTVVMARPDRPSDLNKELLTAIEDGNMTIMDLLLDRGARPRGVEPSLTRFMENNPVWLAVASSNPVALRRLAERGYIAGTETYAASLFCRAAKGKVSTFEAMTDVYGAPNAHILSRALDALEQGLRSSQNPHSHEGNIPRRRHLDMLYHLSHDAATPLEALQKAMKGSIERDDVDAAHIVLGAIRSRFKTEIDFPELLRESANWVKNDNTGIGLLLRQMPEWVERVALTVPTADASQDPARKRPR